MGADAKDLALKMWLFPYLTWLSIVAIAALLVGMAIVPQTREALLLSMGLAAVVVAIGVYRYRKNGPQEGAANDRTGGRKDEVQSMP